MVNSDVKYGIFEKHSWKDVLWNMGNQTGGLTRRYYFYEERHGNQKLLTKSDLLALLSKNEGIAAYISKEDRNKQYISPENIVISDNGEFFVGVVNMNYVKKILAYLNAAAANS